jgi:hypothetical protein
MEMDIAKLSMNIASANVSQEVSLRLFKKSLEQVEEVGNMLERMLPPPPVAAVSIDSSVGRHLDISL